LISAASHPWELKDEDFVKAHALTPDDQPGEGDGNGLGRTFPHIPATSTSSPLQTLRYTPAMDRVLLDAALASIDEKQERAMLLAISLSTFDYVGHVWGPDSWESWDELVRLDYELARFFTHLDRKVGADGWSLVLSADHGTTSMPEVPESAHPWCKPGASNRLAQPCGAVTRVIPAALTEDLKTLAEKTLGKGDWILGVADPYVYFTTNALSHPKRAELENAVIDALKKHPEVDTVMRGGRREFCGKSDSVEDGICHSLAEKTKDTLYIALKPGSFFDSGHALGRGSSHGSPYPFDRSVPLFVRALARAHPGEVIRDRVSFESFAKTVCSLLGVEPLAAAKDARDFAP
jgi:arylsulfatase A-like enzyme